MRLIDADALLEKLGMANDCANCKNGKFPICLMSTEMMEVCDAITDAPTIVKGSEIYKPKPWNWEERRQKCQTTKSS